MMAMKKNLTLLLISTTIAFATVPAYGITLEYGDGYYASIGTDTMLDLSTTSIGIDFTDYFETRVNKFEAGNRLLFDIGGDYIRFVAQPTLGAIALQIREVDPYNKDGDRFDAVFIYDSFLLTSKYFPAYDAPANVNRNDTTYRIADFTKAGYLPNGAGIYYFDMDWLYLNIPSPYFNLKVGRQPVGLGTSNVYSPLDVYNIYLNSEYRYGIDVMRMDIPVGLSEINVIYGLSTNESSKTIMVRSNLNAEAVDAQLQGGTINRCGLLGTDVGYLCKITRSNYGGGSLEKHFYSFGFYVEGAMHQISYFNSGANELSDSEANFLNREVNFTAPEGKPNGNPLFYQVSTGTEYSSGNLRLTAEYYFQDSANKAMEDVLEEVKGSDDDEDVDIDAKVVTAGIEYELYSRFRFKSSYSYVPTDKSSQFSAHAEYLINNYFNVGVTAESNRGSFKDVYPTNATSFATALNVYF